MDFSRYQRIQPIPDPTMSQNQEIIEQVITPFTAIIDSTEKAMKEIQEKFIQCVDEEVQRRMNAFLNTQHRDEVCMRCEGKVVLTEDDYQVMEVNLASQDEEIHRLAGMLQSAHDTITRNVSTFKEWKSAFEEKEAEVAQVRTEYETLRQATQKFADENNFLKLEIDGVNKDLIESRQRVSQLEEEVAKLNKAKETTANLLLNTTGRGVPMQLNTQGLSSSAVPFRPTPAPLSVVSAQLPPPIVAKSTWYDSDEDNDDKVDAEAEDTPVVATVAQQAHADRDNIAPLSNVQKTGTNSILQRLAAMRGQVASASTNDKVVQTVEKKVEAQATEKKPVTAQDTEKKPVTTQATEKKPVTAQATEKKPVVSQATEKKIKGEIVDNVSKVWIKGLTLGEFETLLIKEKMASGAAEHYLRCYKDSVTFDKDTWYGIDYSHPETSVNIRRPTATSAGPVKGTLCLIRTN